MAKKRSATWRGCVLLLLGFVAGLGLSATAQAQISVIVAKSAKLDANDLKKSEVKEIFTGNKLKWTDGNKIQVVDQAESDLGEKFYREVLGKSLLQVRRHWTRLVLSGQASAPLQFSSDKLVKKAVAGNPYAIGYIASAALDGSVKEILRLHVEELKTK